MVNTIVDLSSKKEDRFDYLDIAKGIGIISVLFSHSCGFPFDGGRYLTAYYMQMFFIISGFVYYDNKEGTASKIYKRFNKLIIPYFGFNLLLFSYDLVIKILKNEFIFKDIGINIFGIIYSRYSVYPLGLETNIYISKIGNQAMWFLTSMFVSSVIFYFIIEKVLSSRFIMILTIIVLISITYILNALPILLPWSVDTAFVGSLFMIIGIMIRRKKISSRFTFSKLLLFVLIGLMYILLCNNNLGINMSVRDYGTSKDFNIIYFIAIGLLGTIIIIWFSQLISKIKFGKYLSAIGKNTIVLLALHLVIFDLLNKINNKLLIFDLENIYFYWIFSLAKILIVIILSYLWSYYVKIIKKKIHS